MEYLRSGGNVGGSSKSAGGGIRTHRSWCACLSGHGMVVIGEAVLVGQSVSHFFPIACFTLNSCGLNHRMMPGSISVVRAIGHTRPIRDGSNSYGRTKVLTRRITPPMRVQIRSPRQSIHRVPSSLGVVSIDSSALVSC